MACKCTPRAKRASCGGPQLIQRLPNRFTGFGVGGAKANEGLLTVEKKGKKNIFSGRVLEIEGLGDLTVEQAFELSDASAERSAAGCTIELSEESIAEYLRSNIVLLRSMIADGYGDPRTLERRALVSENRELRQQLDPDQIFVTDYWRRHLGIS